MEKIYAYLWICLRFMRIRQVLSGGLGINFRGSGFYINDSNSKKNATSEASAKSSKNCSGWAASSCNGC